MMERGRDLVLVSVILILIDQVSKFFVRLCLNPGVSVPVLRNIFHITYTQNTGAVFGLLKGFNDMFIWITFVAVGTILYFWDRFPEEGRLRLFLALIVTGSVGNFIDRVALGYVTDFLDFRFWPMFNIADSLICIGVVGAAIFILLEDRKKDKNDNGKGRLRKKRI